MDRASTTRFYDHYGHVSAAVCYHNTLHARKGDGRLDHARTHGPRVRKGVKSYGVSAARSPRAKDQKDRALADAWSRDLSLHIAAAVRYVKKKTACKKLAPLKKELVLQFAHCSAPLPSSSRRM